jgi:hypothetical protein
MIFESVNVKFTGSPHTSTKIFNIATRATGVSFLTGATPQTCVASELKEGIGRPKVAQEFNRFMQLNPLQAPLC